MLQRIGKKERLRSLAESAEPTVTERQQKNPLFFFLSMLHTKIYYKTKDPLQSCPAQTLLQYKKHALVPSAAFPPPPLSSALFLTLPLLSEWPSANRQGEQYEKPNKQPCASKTRLYKEVRAQELKQRTSSEMLGISCPGQFWQKARAFTLLFG